jgi:hypothetical protein
MAPSLAAAAVGGYFFLDAAVMLDVCARVPALDDDAETPLGCFLCLTTRTLARTLG